MKRPSPPPGTRPRPSHRLVLPEGALLIDKPGGMTSHDVVDAVRRYIRPMKVGHTGTLDPFATGLLPLCLGRATRLSRFLSLADKGYQGLIELGTRTTTYDRDGEVLARSEVPGGWETEVVRILARIRGTISLTPPPFSAKKVMGKPLYEFARAEIHIKRKPVESRIHRMEATEFLPQAFRFHAEVSAGTYLRSLADAIGVELGCGAHLKELRRTACGTISVDRAIPLDRLQEMLETDPSTAGTVVVPMREIPLGMETLVVNARGRAAILHGRRFGPPGLLRIAEGSPGPFFRVEDGSGDLLAIAETIPLPGNRYRPLWKPVLVFSHQETAPAAAGI